MIHSTDDLIEATGDYNEFFKKINESKNFVELSRMHSLNLSNAIKSMKEGLSPVVIDNTNIKKNEPKAYVEAALKLGYADQNIKFVDVGTSGLTAEELAARNRHGVLLSKIKQMMESHKSHGELTLESVLNSKDMYKDSNVLYSGVVLDEESKTKLLSFDYPIEIPEDWTKIAHHMTIAFGKGVENKADLGKEVTLTVNFIGKSDMAMAVRVTGYPSKNEIPHITLAVNPDGGKPVMSNDINEWVGIKPFTVSGIVTEIKKKI